VYLVSPETAVASALAGEIVDPREFFAAQPSPVAAGIEHFTVNDSMIIAPPADSSAVQIVRGPNIGDPPAGSKLPERIDGVVTICLGDKITTDHIMPAGNRLKYRSNIPKYAEFVFEPVDPGFAARALDNKQRGVHTIIVAGESYGQGSSREHAAICPMYLGVRMVIAKSIERIHRANLINFGIIPAVFSTAADYDALPAGTRITADDVVDALTKGNTLLLKTANREIRVNVGLSEREKKILAAGGLLLALTKA
jgi:aconitate hydratase